MRPFLVLTNPATEIEVGKNLERMISVNMIDRQRLVETSKKSDALGYCLKKESLYIITFQITQFN